MYSRVLFCNIVKRFTLLLLRSVIGVRAPCVHNAKNENPKVKVNDASIFFLYQYSMDLQLHSIHPKENHPIQRNIIAEH